MISSHPLHLNTSNNLKRKWYTCEWGNEVHVILTLVRIKEFRKWIPNKAAQPLRNYFILTYISYLQSQNVHRLQLGQKRLLARLSLLKISFFQWSVRNTMETSDSGLWGYFNDVLQTNLVITTRKLSKCNNNQILLYILQALDLVVNLYTHWRRRRHTLPPALFLTNVYDQLIGPITHNYTCSMVCHAHCPIAQFVMRAQLARDVDVPSRWWCNILQDHKGLERASQILYKRLIRVGERFVRVGCSVLVVGSNKSGWRPTYCW